MTLRRSRLPHFVTKHQRKHRRSVVDRTLERQLLLEPLEDRRLLATGPQLTGLQPNNGDHFSFTDATLNVRSEAPQQLTLRFDENQILDSASVSSSSIRIVRGGTDGVIGNQPEDFVTPGYIGVGDAPRQNEVIVRFASPLPDDVYRVEILGVGSASPLRNVAAQSGLAFVPTLNDGDGDPTKDSVSFELDLGPQVVAVVPQPVSRNAQGGLSQARNQIQVYFNNDDLLVASDSLGRPLPQSAENPNFYQLLFTADTVRNTDDVVIRPSSVSYDPVSNLSTLTFEQDLDKLLNPNTGVLIGPGSFRLRVGTDEPVPLPPMTLAPAQSITTDFNTGDQVLVQLTGVERGETGAAVFVTRRDFGGPGAPLVRVLGRAVAIELNSNAGNESTANDVVAAVNRHAAARKLVVASVTSGSGATLVGNRAVNYSPLELAGMGDAFSTATNLADDTDIGAILTVSTAGISFVDGDYFEITDASNVRRKFEFDSDLPPIKNDATAISVPFAANDSQVEMTNAIADAINAASFGVRASVAGNDIRLTGDQLVDLSSGPHGIVKRFLNQFDNGQILDVTATGNGFVEGTTFQVVDTHGAVRTFEFDSGYTLGMSLSPLSLVVPVNGAGLVDGQTFSINDGATTKVFEFEDLGSGNGVGVGNREVRYLPGSSADVIGLAVANAINQSVTANELKGLVATNLGGGLVELRATTAAANATTVQTLTSPLTQLALDGQTWQIQQGANVMTFEFNRDNTFVDANVDLVPDNELISFSLRDTTADVLAKVAAKIQSLVDLGRLNGLTPSQLNGNQVHLGGTSATALVIAGASHLSLVTTPSVTPGNFPVVRASHSSFTAASVARSVADAINAPGGLFAARALAVGNQVRLSQERFALIPTNVDHLSTTLQGRFDAGPALHVVRDGSRFVDGQSIRIRDDQGTTFSVEFDSDGSLADPAARPVVFTAASSAAHIARGIAQAINLAGSRVIATVVGETVSLTNDRDVRLSETLYGVEKTSQGLSISSTIDPRSFALDFPGNNDEPGHRDIPAEVGDGSDQHINTNFGDNGRDATDGVTTVLYNFRSDFGTSPQGTALQNAITEGQKQRARDAFSLWSHYLGIQFVETEKEGLTIATGDLRALDPVDPTVLPYTQNNFRVRIDPELTRGLLVMDSSIQWSDDYGQNWFVNAMIGIGTMLGLERANDLPQSTLMAFTSTFSYPNSPTHEPIYPGNFDILHGQHLYRPDGVDIDMYRFTIDVDPGRVGLFTAETFAERLPNASQLDTVLSLYRENPDGSRELISRNDDYYSRDSYLEMNLTAGVYYVAVHASGNTTFDPVIGETGIGGTSQGTYDLRLNFRSQVDQADSLRDRDGNLTALDGDLDGTPGGVYNFWFQTRGLNRVLTVTSSGSGFQDGQILTVVNSSGAVRRYEFDNNNSISAGNTRISFTSSSTPVAMAQAIAGAIAGTSNFGVTASSAGHTVVLGDPLTQAGAERSVTLSSGFSGLRVEGRTIFVDKAAGPNADGSLGKPFNNIASSTVANAFAAARENDIVRIVGNGGTDGNLSTVGDNFGYEIGFSTLPGQNLTDGTEMSVPKGVNVMIDPGAVFKLRRSAIQVGSSSLTIDRSGSSMQVLGTPDNHVVFTSWLDESRGRDSHPPTTVPGRGDWGGILFRSDIDSEESRATLEDQGIFLNYVNHADILYGGGGNVVIDGVQQVVNPIQMLQTRPTVTFNEIRNSADSAMSASPNSFSETNFHSPRHQANGTFTSDYTRVGPEIRGNYLIDNSNNGLFIRIETPAGNALLPLTVSGRFDDVDVVHLLSENLVIDGSDGEPYLDLARPAVQLVTFTSLNGGALAAGTYAYKLTFVDENGFESLASLPTTNYTITPAQSVAGIGSVRLNQLPPASGDYVARRLYRLDDPINGVYRLVAQMNASDTVYTDRGGAATTELRRDPPSVAGLTLAAQPRGELAGGTYAYRVVFVDALGREGAASDASASILVSGAPANGGVLLGNLPVARGEFVSRRIYRSQSNAAGPFDLVAELNADDASYFDDGSSLGGTLDLGTLGVLRARPHARLAIDPGTVVKMEGARFETRFGGQIIAEGLAGREVVFTSRMDDAYGAGGTFDTNDDDRRGTAENRPSPGDWGGFYIGPLGALSIDHAQVSFGGGQNTIEGTTTSFNVIELHQATARITNSVIEDNANGIGGQGPLDRFGRGYNLPATIFVRGSQPVILNNIIRDNVNPSAASFNPANGNNARDNAAITINLNSLTQDLITDPGRSRGSIDREPLYGDNHGPLVRGNRLDNNGLNGMVVRGGELTTQSIWDDTDIVHVVTNRYDDTRFGWRFDEVLIPDLHTYGGVRLQSSPTESLVVKLEGQGNVGQNYNLNPTNGAGFTATGRPLEIADRVGGTLQVVGQPGFPVVLTSIHDDTAGAGVRPDNSPQLDTNNNGTTTTPAAGNWRGLRLDQYSNDRNVEIITELEPANETAPGRNATTTTAQYLGQLAADETSGDSQLRMGFEVQGFLTQDRDLDVYSFNAEAGTEIYVDIDRTTFSLDTVIELLDSSGNVLARSNDAIDGSASIEFVDASLQNRSQNLVNPLQRSPVPYYPTHVSGLPRDSYSVNPRDAGMRISLPGNSGTRSTYHLRIRSADGLTSGAYQVQVRLRETDEFPGSTVRFADIRYAQNGIQVVGLPGHSPLLGEASENEDIDGTNANNGSAIPNPTLPGARPQSLGNLFASDRGVFSVGGALSSAADVDFYTFRVNYNAVTDPDTRHGAVVFDLDYADSLNRPNTTLAVFNAIGQLILVGRDSNIAEDRPGPLAGSDLTDLSRGSVGTGDPFIGPAELPEGTYYVAVVPNSRMPSVLDQFTSAATTNTLVRLEPVNSIVRLAEDHVESSGGSTAEAPVLSRLLDPSRLGVGTGLWGVTTNRSADLGHGLGPVFDGTRGTAVVTGDVEPNNTLLSAQNIDSAAWSLAANVNIGDSTINTSQLIPHVTIDGTGDGTYDYYSFTTTSALTRVILDIDFGQTGGPGSFDSEIALWDSTGALIASNDDSSTTQGAGGSVSLFDSFLETTLTSPGTYIVGVARFPAVEANQGFTGLGVPVDGTYQLHVSVENHALGGGGTGRGGSSYYYGNPATQTVPNGSAGSWDSETFSLAGYSAADLPVLYFSYYLNSAPSDVFTVSVVDGAGNASLIASANSADVAGEIRQVFQAGGSTWRQARVSLSSFAGRDDLRLRFNYQKVGPLPSEGVYLDDLIIGFAERGEMVSGSSVLPQFSVNPDAPGGGAEILVGDYQLEIRKATEFGQSGDFGARTLVLTDSIDTNDRLAPQTTLIAPRGSEVVEEQSFSISDGVNTVVFEYEDPQLGNGVSEEGRVEIRFKVPDNTQPSGYRFATNYEIAASIRDAINSPQVQSRIALRAALSDGTASGTGSRDYRVNLFGNADVSQRPEFAATANTDANQLRDLILGQGLSSAGNAMLIGGLNSAGTFVGGNPILGMEEGILLSTGNVATANGPNDNDSSSGRASGAGAAWLDQAFGVTTKDVSALQFDFNLTTLSQDDLALNFVFASEEYNEGAGTLRDVLAVFLDGVDITKNLAVVTVAGNPRPVSTATIHRGFPYDVTGATGVNPTLYRNNDPSDAGAWLSSFGYDGFTAVLTARLADLDPNVPHRIIIAVADTEDLTGDSAVFVESHSLIAYNGSDPAAADHYVRPPSGIESIRHGGAGDQNVLRDQGQVLIHSNTIRDSADFAITTAGGERDGEETSLDGVTVGRMQPHSGPTRRLRDLNDLGNAGILGGFTPGVVIENNTITGEGLGGISISGNLTPLELAIWPSETDAAGNSANWTSGDHYCDGDVFSLTVGRQTVVFEFVDTSGSGAIDVTRPCWIGGGGTVAWVPGRVPIFYRRTDASQSGYSATEMALAIKEAIDNSPLIENQTTYVSQAYITTSWATTGGLTAPIPPATQTTIPNVAVYVERVAYFEESHHFSIRQMHQSERFLPIADAAQPFVQVVNNTIYGSDGNAASSAKAPVEPDDTIATATQTMQGRAHNPEIYTAAGILGNSTQFRGDNTKDVDFYQFQMEIGDRAVIQVNTNNLVDAMLRLFDSAGKELARVDTTGLLDPVLTYDSLAAGTYYVAVSGSGNGSYSPTSLGDRTSSNATGTYTISVDVQAPRDFLIDLKDIFGGASFDITTVSGRTANVSANGSNPATAARNLVAAIQAAGLPGVSASTIGRRIWDYINRDGGNSDYERYVVINGASKVLGVGASAAELLPFVSNNVTSINEDQLLRETGILISEGATPTLMNNVLANLRNGVIEAGAYRDTTDQFHYRDRPVSNRGRTTSIPSTHPILAVSVGQMFQNTPFGTQGVSLPPNTVGIGTRFLVTDTALLNNIERYDSLVDSVDFNIVVPGSETLFVNAPADNFFPAESARSIDSAVDTLSERQQFELIKSSAGISLSPILSPDTDGSGQLRADDQEVDTPQGQGANVFKDRGSLDRADFVGPSASLLTPQDNDADGLDLDPARSTVQLPSGVYREFTIQVVDGFESADPFPGVGVDDDTLDGQRVPVTEGNLQLNLRGPAVTLFQDGVYLREGYDYTYRYDRTSNTIRLTPMTGVWPNGKVYVIKLNNRDRFVIDTSAGGSVPDGQTFEITNSVGDKVTMEYESGFSLQVPQTLGVQVPLVGTATGGIIDGQRFSVTDGLRTVNFEFDRNGNTLPGNRPLLFNLGDTADQLADKLVAALQQVSDLGLIAKLTPRNLGGGFVHLGASPAHLFDFSNSALTTSIAQRPYSLIIPANGGAGIADGENFTITRGSQSVTFEFDQGTSTTITGSIRIPVTSADTADFVASAVRDALVSNNALPLALSPVAVPGGIVELGATPAHTVNISQAPSLVRTIYVGGVRDGERFQIRNGNAGVATFEFDSDGKFVDADNNQIPDFTLLPFSQASTHLDLAQLITDKVATAGVGLSPINVGNGLINLGGTVQHTVDANLAPSLSLTGQPGVRSTTTLHLPTSPAIQIPAVGVAAGGIVDGQTFTISQTTSAGVTTTKVFEFDTDQITTPGNVVVAVQPGDTPLLVSTALQTALISASLALTPSQIGNDIIQLGGTGAYTISLVGSSLTRADRIGSLTDGQFFTMNNGTTTVTFEFEDLALNNGVQSGRTPILFSSTSSVDVVANALAAALRGAGLGLNPIYNNDGTGRVETGDSVRHLTNLSGAPSLTRSGTPGGSQAINYRLNYSEEEVAKAAVAGINSLGSRISGVSSQVRGGSTVFVDISDAQGQPANFSESYAALSGTSNFFLPAISDLPGSSLKANQANNETQFTILLPGVSLDYGDLPDSLFGPGRYSTLFENDGPRHVITENPLYLGASIDADSDGLPTVGADGDDSDVRINLGTTPLSLRSLAPYHLQIPVNGAAGINDNATFTITRGTTTVRFEFDKNSSGLSGGSDERIALTGTETQDDLSDKIVSSVLSRLNELVLRPVNLGAGVILLGGTESLVAGTYIPSHTVNLAGSGLAFANQTPAAVTTPGAGLSLTMSPKLQIQVPVGGGGVFVDGSTFTISDSVNPEVTFEFDNNGNFTAANRRISFSGLVGQDTMAADILAAIRQAQLDGALNGLAPVYLGNGLIDLGARGAHHLNVTNTALTQVGPVQDGDVFTIADGVNTVSFEIDIDPVPNVGGGNERIAATPASSADDIAAAIVTSIKNVVQANRLVAVTPTHIGEGIIDIDSPTPAGPINVTLTSASPNLLAAGTAGGVSDGETLTVSDGNSLRTFEFDRLANGVFTPGNIPVGFAATATPDQVANALSDAINGLTAITRGAAAGAGLSVSIPARQELVVPAGGGGAIVDGAFFTITNGSTSSVTFEFDSNGSTTAGRRSIVFTLAMTRDQVADAVVAAVQAAVTQGAVSGLAPANLGAGVVSLGAQATHGVDASQSSMTHRGPVADGDVVTVTATGFAPLSFEFDNDANFVAGRRRVAFTAAGSANDLASALAAEFANAVTAGSVPALSARALGGGLVDVDTSAAMTLAATGNLAVAGVAGGVSDGDMFTFSDGIRTVDFEFDRAEQSAVAAGRVRVPFARTATGEQVAASIRTAVRTSGVTVQTLAEAGGVVTFRNADTAGVASQRVNDDDGVRIQGILTPVIPSDPLRANLKTTVVVTSSGDGFLDAWFDWNQDGDFADPNEQVFTSVPVVAGANTLQVQVPAAFPNPSTLPLGDTYARFRVSRDGRLQPTGLAVDGEVEDYRVRVVSNARPELVGIGIPDVVADEDGQSNDVDLSLDPSTYFSDIDITNGNGDFLSYSVVSNTPGLVNATVNGNRIELDYLKDQNGSGSVTVTVTDQGGLTLVQTFSVSLAKRNVAPTATPRNTDDTDLDILEDTPVTIVLTGDDGDPLAGEVQQLTFVMCPGAGNPAVGTVSAFTSIDDHTARITYTPPAEFNGTATFTYCVRDDGNAGAPANLLSAPATVRVNVARVNDAPIASTTPVFSQTPTEDTDVLVTLAGSDIDPVSGQVLTFNVPATTSRGGSLTFEQRIDATHVQYRYRPAVNVNGDDTFSFTVTDQDNATIPAPVTSAPATVTITLSPVNDAPLANNQSVSVVEDTALAFTLAADDGDPEVTQALTLEIVSQPSNGTLSLFNASTGQVTYTPNTGYTGNDSFTYRIVRDDATAGNPANLASLANGVVSITVTPVNDPPVVTIPVTPIAVNEDATSTFTIRVDDGDTEATQVLSYLADVNPTHGTLQFQGFQTNGVTTDIVFGYTPTANYNGPDSFTFRLRDNGNPNETSALATISLSVVPVNDPPVANSASVTTNEDVPVQITLTGNDGDPLATENQTLVFEIVTAPSNGSVTLGAATATTRVATYTPSSNSNGTDFFTYRVRDDNTAGAPFQLNSAPVTVTVTVNPVNDAPEFTVGPNVDVDEDSGAKTVIGWATGVRPGPVNAGDEGGQNVTFTVTNNNNSLFLLNAQPAVSSSGTLTFTPAPNANGVAEVVLFADDNSNNVAPNVSRSAPQTFTITVRPINDAPQFLVGPSDIINEDAGLRTVVGWARPNNSPILPGPANAADEVGQTLTFNVSVETTGSLAFVTPPSVNSTTGTLTYQTAPNTNGSARVTVTLSDNGSGATPHANTSAPQTFSITVVPLNDAPEFTLSQTTVNTTEDAGLFRVTGLAGNVRPGPATAVDEATQRTTFAVTVPSTQGGLLFTTPPQVDANGDLTFQTAPDKHGSATVVIRIRDDGPFSVNPSQQNESAPQTVTIVVSPVNDAPQFTAGADQTVTEDAGPQTVVGWATGIRPGPLTATDEASQTVTFSVSSDNTSLFSVAPAISPTGTLTYTSAPDANGTALLTVTATDSGSPAAQLQQQFRITVTPVNDAPIVTVPSLQTVAEDTTIFVAGVSVADVDAPILQVKLSAPNGIVSVKNNVVGGVPATGILNNDSGTVTLTGTPAAINQTLANAQGLSYRGVLNYNGFDGLSVTADDLGNIGSPGPLTHTQTLRFNVTPVNDAPQLVNPLGRMDLTEDSPDTLIELFPRVFDDPDIATNNDQITLSVVSNSNSNLVSAAILGTKLNLHLLPNQNGQAVIILRATDRSGLNAVPDNTFTLDVAPVNDPPMAVADAIMVQANTTSTLNVLGNDQDVDGTINVGTVQVTSAPNNATVSVNADGSIRFVPATNFSGVSKFRYLVQDNLGAPSNEAEVTVTVNSLPVANNDSGATTQGIPVIVDVTANDTDSDGTVNKTTVAITRVPTNGTVTVNPTTGAVTYTPNSIFSGTDNFRYRVLDNAGGVSNEATVTISVTPTRFWQNKPNALDVNNDGRVSPIDVLQIVNRLNTNGAGVLPVPTPSFAPPPFYDVNGDGNISPADALVIINAINDNTAGEGEGSFGEMVGAGVEDSVGQPFNVLVGTTFNEYRYIPLVNPATSTHEGAAGLTSRTDRAVAVGVDEALASLAGVEWTGREDSPSQSRYSGMAPAAEVLTSVVAEDAAHYESSLDAALDEIFGDVEEQ